MGKRKSITTTFMIFIVLITVIPLTAISSMLFYQSKEVIKSQIFDHISAITLLKEHKMNLWISCCEHAVETLARFPEIRENMMKLLNNTDKEARAAILKHFNNMIGRDFTEIFIIDARTGEVLLSTDASQEGKIKSNRVYFVEGKMHTMVTPVYHSISHGVPTMLVATPIYNCSGAGGVTGVLVGRLNLTRINDIMKEPSGLGHTGETYLVNAYHFFITDPRYQPGSALRKTVFSEGVREALTKRTSGVGLYENYKNIPVIGAYRYIPSINACIISEIAQEEAFSCIDMLGLYAFSTCFAILLFSLSLGFVFMQRFTRPLKQLSEGAVRVGRGDLDFHMDIKRDDEIGTLVSCFNNMVRDLKRSRDELEEYSRTLERKVEEKVKELEETQRRMSNSERLAALGRLSSSIAHEINNPLGGIKNCLFIIEKFVSEEGKKYLKLAENEIERISTIIRRLSDIYRPTADVKMPVNVNILLEDVVELLEKEMREKGIEVRCDFDETPNILASAGKLKQVFLNIILNAIDAMPNSGKLEIKTFADDCNVVVEISDTGIGIPEENIGRIFEPFFTTKEKGSGLGLSVSYGIIHEHDGDIRVSSKVGKGTKFIITLPAQRNKKHGDCDRGDVLR